MSDSSIVDSLLLLIHIHSIYRHKGVFCSSFLPRYFRNAGENDSCAVVCLKTVWKEYVKLLGAAASCSLIFPWV